MLKQPPSEREFSCDRASNEQACYPAGMEPTSRRLSTSAERRAEIIDAALVAFSVRGYYGTTTATIAAAANLSEGYLYKIWPNKEALFAAVLNEVKLRLRAAILESVEIFEASGRPFSAGDVLRERATRTGVDPTATMVLLHATAASSVPALRRAVAECYSDQVDFLRQRLGATDGEIHHYLATGQLINSINALNPTPEERSAWADSLRGSGV